jgi:endoglucanase
VILGQNDVVLEEGRAYTITVTATASPQTNVRVLVDPGGQLDATATLRPDGQTFPQSFEATTTTDDGQVMLQVGGNDGFEFCVDTVSLTTGGEVPRFEHDTGPRVRVNQVGYLPDGPKRATLVTDEAEPVAWELHDAAGEPVAQGQTIR